MQQLLEQRNAIKFGVRLGWSPSATKRAIDQAYRDSAMSRSRVFHWHKSFREDVQLPATDAPRCGGPHSARLPGNILKVRELVEADRRITLARICLLVNISMGSAHAIMKNDLKLRRIAAKFVPRILTAEQMKERKDVSQKNLDLVEASPDLLESVITGDETWLSCFEPESKQSSSQWLPAGAPRPRKSRATRTVRKTMMTAFFDHKGLIHVEFMPKGSTINGEAYRSMLANLRERIRCKRPDLWRSGYHILHDNAHPHTTFATVTRMMETDMDTLDHPPYSPDLAPCDFFLFPALKRHLRGRRFGSVQLLQAEAVHFLSSVLDEKLFSKCIMVDLPDRWNQCVLSGGAYFEGVKNLRAPQGTPEDPDSDNSDGSMSDVY